MESVRVAKSHGYGSCDIHPQAILKEGLEAMELDEFSTIERDFTELGRFCMSHQLIDLLGKLLVNTAYSCTARSYAALGIAIGSQREVTQKVTEKILNLILDPKIQTAAKALLLSENP